MREHVCALCGDYSLLFPAENIGFIAPVPGATRFGRWLDRRRAAGPSEPVLDVRRLLEVPRPARPEEGVTMRWRSTDGRREVALLVDGVEEIVNCYAGDLIDVAILPRRLRPLCDQVMREPRGRLRLRVKPDVQLPLERGADRRRYLRALLTMGSSP